MLSSPAKSRVAKRIERCVLALVPIVFLVELLDQYLYFVVWQRRMDVLEVVFNVRVLPVYGVNLLEIDAHVEQGIVPAAFWNALRAKGLKTRRAVWDDLLGLLWGLRHNQVSALYVGLDHLIELFQGSSTAVFLDAVAHGLVATEIRQVQKVARVATVHKYFSLFRKDFSSCFSQQCGRSLQVLLHACGSNRLLGEQEDMRATRLAATNNKR